MADIKWLNSFLEQYLIDIKAGRNRGPLNFAFDTETSKLAHGVVDVYDVNSFSDINVRSRFDKLAILEYAGYLSEGDIPTSKYNVINTTAAADVIEITDLPASEVLQRLETHEGERLAKRQIAEQIEVAKRSLLKTQNTNYTISTLVNDLEAGLKVGERKQAFVYRNIYRTPDNRFFITKQGFHKFSKSRFYNIFTGQPGQVLKNRVKLSTQEQLATDVNSVFSTLLGYTNKIRQVSGYENFGINIFGANPWFDVLATESLLSARRGLVDTDVDLITAFQEGKFKTQDVQQAYINYVYNLSKKYKGMDLYFSKRAVQELFSDNTELLNILRTHKKYSKYFDPNTGEIISNILIDDEFRDLIFKYGGGRDALKYVSGQRMEKISKVLGIKNFSHHADKDILHELLAYSKLTKLTKSDNIRAEQAFVKNWSKVMGRNVIIKTAKAVEHLNLLSEQSRVLKETLTHVKTRTGLYALIGLAGYAGYRFLTAEKKEDYNIIKGLPSGWWADQMKESTDFGSPYQGPEKYSAPVARQFMSNAMTKRYFMPYSDRSLGVWSTRPTQSVFTHDTDQYKGIIARTALVGGVAAGLYGFAYYTPHLAYKAAVGLERLGVDIGTLRFPGALAKPFNLAELMWSRAVVTPISKTEKYIFKSLGVNLEVLDALMEPGYKRLLDRLSKISLFNSKYVSIVENLSQKKNYVNDIYTLNLSGKAYTKWFNDRKTLDYIKRHSLNKPYGTSPEEIATKFEQQFGIVLFKKSNTKRGWAERWVFAPDQSVYKEALEALELESTSEQVEWLAQKFSDKTEFAKFFKLASEVNDVQGVYFRPRKPGRIAEMEAIGSGLIREKFIDRLNLLRSTDYASRKASESLYKSGLGHLEGSSTYNILKWLRTRYSEFQTLFGLGPGKNELFAARVSIGPVIAEDTQVFKHVPRSINLLGKNIALDSASWLGKINRGLAAAERYSLSGLYSLSNSLNEIPVLGWKIGLGLDPRSFKGSLGLLTKLSFLALGIYGAAHYMSYLDYKTKGEDNAGVLGKLWWAGLKLGRIYPAKLADTIPGARKVRDIVEWAAPNNPLAALGIGMTLAYAPHLINAVVSRNKLNLKKVASRLSESTAYDAIFLDTVDTPKFDSIFLKRLKTHLTQRIKGATPFDVSTYLDYKKAISQGELDIKPPSELISKLEGIDSEVLNFTKKVLTKEMHMALPDSLKLLSSRQLLEHERMFTKDIGLIETFARRLAVKMVPKTWAGVGKLAAALVTLPLIYKMVVPKESEQELLDIYSGRQLVPIRRGRYWGLSKAAFQGERIMYYRPHAFHLYRTQARTKAIYGSEDKYWESDMFIHPIKAWKEPRALKVAYEHYEDRPYPIEPIIGSELPGILGPIASTVTRTLRSPKLMHTEEWLNTYGAEGNITNINLSKASSVYFPNVAGAKLEPFYDIGGELPAKPTAPNIMKDISELSNRYSQISGMVGFTSETLMNYITGKKNFDEDIQYLEDAGAITSLSKQYYEKQLGDPGGTCFVGDTLIKTENGYVKIKDVNIGDKVLSLDGKYHAVIDIVKYDKPQSEIVKLSVFNVTDILVTANHYVPVYDKYSKTFRDIQVKYLTNTRYAVLKLDSSDNSFIPEFDYTIEFTDINEEVYDLTIENLHYYVVEQVCVHNTEALRRFLTKDRLKKQNYYNPIVNKVPSWLSAADTYLDIKHGDPFSKIPEGNIRLPGPGFEALYPELKGVSYEEYPLWARYKILSDVFPYSEQTKRLQKRVESLAKAGDTKYQQLLEQVEYQNKTREQRIELYKPRFIYNDIETKDLTVKEVKNNGSIITEEMPGQEIRLSGIDMSTAHLEEVNDLLKQAAKPGTHINILTQKDPLKRLKKDGNTYYINAIVHAHGQNINKLILDNNLAVFKEKEEFDIPQLKTGVAGRLLGSYTEHLARIVNTIPPPFGILAQKFSPQRSAIEDYEWGEVYGTRESFWTRPWGNIVRPVLSELGHKYFGINDIPEDVKRRREIIEYFDKLKYIKHRRLYEEAQVVGDFESASFHKWRYRSTMFGANPFGSAKRWKYIADRREQPYIDAFVNATVKERAKIINLAPSYMKSFYLAQWAKKEENVLKAKLKDNNEISEDDKFKLKAIRNARYTQGMSITPELWEKYQEESKLSGETYVDWAKRQELIKYFSTHPLPKENWIGYNPKVDLDDVKLRVVQNEGLTKYDFNLWDDREAALKRKPYLDDNIPDLEAHNLEDIRNVEVRLNDILELEDKINYDITRKSIYSMTASENNNMNINIKIQDTFNTEYDKILKRAMYGTDRRQ